MAVIYVLQTIFPTAYDSLIMRFKESDMSTGRNDIFSYFNNELSTNMRLLFFGVGFQDYGTKLLTQYSSSIPHNGFQELLVMWGIPGLIAFSAFLLSLVDRARKLNNRMRFINFVPYIVMLINIQVSQMVSSSVVSILIAFVYICLVTDMQDTFDQECKDTNPTYENGSK